ncbi:MAG: hypothetical protein ABI949_11240 [Ilumatobacteraceae bacterium]
MAAQFDRAVLGPAGGGVELPIGAVDTTLRIRPPCPANTSVQAD